MHRWTVFVVLMGFLAVPVWAGPSQNQVENLPEKYRTWLEEEVVYIIADIEEETFLSLEDNEARESFIQAFWRRRDTNPATPENEYRQEHYMRIAYANEFLGRDTSIDGWRTDRGEYHILLGEPHTRQTFDNEDSIYPVELWFYNNPELKRFGLPPFFFLLFWQRQGIGAYELFSPGVDGPESLFTGKPAVSSMDWRDDIRMAYNKLYRIHPELADSTLSFIPNEGDTAQFQAADYGTMQLLQLAAEAPTRGVDLSYAERFDIDRGSVESDYLFSYVPSFAMMNVLPGPRDAHYLHWTIELDPQHVALVQNDDGAYGSLFITSVEIQPRDDPEKLLLQFRKESFLGLTQEQAETKLNVPYSFSGMTPVAPGAYDVRVILRNRACPGRDESSCVKSYTLYESPIQVPEWEPVKPQMSEPVLAWGTGRIAGDPVYRPYRFGGVQVFPNPRLVYAIGEPVVAMVELWNTQPGSVARFRVVNQDTPETVSVESSSPVEEFRLEPIIAELTTEGLEGGRYRLVADLLSSDGLVRDTGIAEFDITPRTSVPRPAVRGLSSNIRPEVPGIVEMSLGEQYLNIENKDRAREFFEAAVDLNPRLGPAIEHLAGLLLEDGESKRVVELLEPVYQNVQDRPEVLFLLGEAYFHENEYVKAGELLERALTLRRPSVQALNALGMSHYRTDNPERARELFERSLSMDSEQPQIKELLDEIKSSGLPPQ